MGLNSYIEERLKDKDILIMTHQIIGYPDMETNKEALKSFERNGVDIVELQIPFSEPVADGPLFVKANQDALEKGIKVEDCLIFVEAAVKSHKMPILIMTYYNIVFAYGEEDFIRRCKDIGVKGLIVPDIPIDEDSSFFALCKEYGVDAVTIATPYSTDERLGQISKAGDGFIYYVPRKGVTGTKTTFDDDISSRVKHVKSVTKSHVAVGFGIQSKADIDNLKGVADIAIMGSKLLMTIEEGGIEGLDSFLGTL
jgi:tryptophan synthase alpha chain